MKKIVYGALMLIGLTACCGAKDTKCSEKEANTKTTETVIRLNVFYTMNDSADIEKINEIGSKLVEASRNDAGCISYDLYKSVTKPNEYIIVETWENDSLLNIHGNAPHFTEYVPQLRSMSSKRHADRFQIEK